MISDKTIREVVKQIVEACRPKSVILFGSYARGRPCKGSDLDIFIVANIPGRPSERFRVIQRAILEQGFGIDLVVRTPGEVKRALKGRDWFVQDIMKHGKILYER